MILGRGRGYHALSVGPHTREAVEGYVKRVLIYSRGFAFRQPSPEEHMRRALTASIALAAIVLAAQSSVRAITGNFVKDFEHPFVGLAVFYDAHGAFAVPHDVVRDFENLMADRHDGL